ncbi:MAG: biotin/lipoyl-containing protein [Pelolinea sp.]|nr:biotin/lipoyl-containing protein [Pelolinea sp.]
MKIHVKIQDKIYEVRIGDILTRPIQANVDGEVFEVWPEEMMVPSAERRSPVVPQVSHPVQPADIGKVDEKSSSKDVLVKAPIPGVIIEVKVSAGETVEYGQELCVLEAMKMKNSIRAGKAGIIDKVIVSAGDQVSQNQTLIEYSREA